MSGNTTRRFISAYYQESEPSAFFSGMFQARPENFYSSEGVELDIIRSEEDVSIAVQDLSTGYRMNSEDLYTNKEFKPPIHKEGIALNSHDLMQRMAGKHTFEDPSFRADVITRMFRGMRKVERKIRRAVELQSAQVLQTGVITLTDIAGTPLYALDYKPKAAHFPTAGVPWDVATLEQKLADIEALADTIRTNGFTDPDEIDFGVAAFNSLINTDGIEKIFDQRRAERGMITSMEKRGNGGIYRGTLEVGNYKLDIFTYNGKYKDPVDGVTKPYLDPRKAIVRSTTSRMDATFGAIPNIGQALGITGRLVPEMPSRMSSRENAMDLFTNVWISNDGEQLFGGVGARPLMVPTAIDTFGCLNTAIGEEPVEPTP